MVSFHSSKQLPVPASFSRQTWREARRASHHLIQPHYTLFPVLIYGQEENLLFPHLYPVCPIPAWKDFPVSSSYYCLGVCSDSPMRKGHLSPLFANYSPCNSVFLSHIVYFVLSTHYLIDICLCVHCIFLYCSVYSVYSSIWHNQRTQRIREACCM